MSVQEDEECRHVKHILHVGKLSTVVVCCCLVLEGKWFSVATEQGTTEVLQ